MIIKICHGKIVHENEYLFRSNRAVLGMMMAIPVGSQ